ncbi:MAG: DUF6519 domain-containing protein [Candidatus Thorarchaeota archaeon]
MVQEDSNCNWWGANLSGTDEKCPKCGKPVAVRLVKREPSGVIRKQGTKGYSGIYQQQGRMLTDADWNELTRIKKDRKTLATVATVRCESCGAVNSLKSSQCKYCDANL